MKRIRRGTALVTIAAALGLAAGVVLDAQAPARVRLVSVAIGAAAPSPRVASSDKRSVVSGLRSDAGVGSALQGGTTEEQAQSSGFHFYNPVIRIGQDFTLRAGDTAREVRTVFGDVTLAGHVERDAIVVFGNVHAKSTAVVDYGLVVIGGSATIDQGAIVNGDLTVVGGTLTAPADFSPGGQHVIIGSPALGSALESILPWITRGLLWGRLIVPDIGWIWAIVGIAFLVYLALGMLFDRPVRACADAIATRPLSTFFLGLLVLVLTIPALAVLAATVIGIAVVPFVLCAMFVGGLVGKTGVARALGRRLVPESVPESRLQSLRSFVLGFVLITLAYMVPLLGVVTWALTSVLAVGSAAMMLRATLRREHPPRERAAAAVVAVPAVSTVGAGPVQAAASAPVASAGSAETDAVSPDAVPPPPPSSPIAGDAALFPRATFLDRVAAFAVDCVLVAVAVQVLDLSVHGGSFPLMLFVYHLAFWAWKGTTLGGIVVGLRVVRTHGRELQFADALVRTLGAVLSLAALGIGCFWMLQDPERQMWHDKIAGTVVVKVPRNVLLP